MEILRSSVIPSSDSIISSFCSVVSGFRSISFRRFVIQMIDILKGCRCEDINHFMRDNDNATSHDLIIT